ncbi:hypothetical protein L227DRAFT_617880 [Lentinus tigrinus ALCF2SS1-6]|uniref:inositol-3-phosphate synthase n=1 Tax=Lentinus tigrinus ALCF2SS1-6 TaxID=1328759 RepID=A0A5C2RQ78_9APHY|nr:hypothetical protein L227DRAFT_617880 [Lentinus tigrinus ALCF2SS1-6]
MDGGAVPRWTRTRQGRVEHVTADGAPSLSVLSQLRVTTTTTVTLVSKTLPLISLPLPHANLYSDPPVPIPILAHALPTLILTVLLTATPPEFLVTAGNKPLSVASYNHLGNNDGHSLSAERQFKSKEIWKSSVVDDMVAANTLLFKPPQPSAPAGTKDAKGEHPDVISSFIKYVPAVGDSKRAIDDPQ